METGDTVTFNVIELFYNPEGGPFIKLEKDGTYYHVSAYDFQTEWDNNLPKTMRCYVKNLNFRLICSDNTHSKANYL